MYSIPFSLTFLQTFFGRLIGGFCALTGLFILTLPIPIVVNSFASYYKVSGQIASPSDNLLLNPTFATRECVSKELVLLL